MRVLIHHLSFLIFTLMLASCGNKSGGSAVGTGATLPKNPKAPQSSTAPSIVVKSPSQTQETTELITVTEGDLATAIEEITETTPITYQPVETSSDISIIIGSVEALEKSDLEEQIELKTEVLETISESLSGGTLDAVEEKALEELAIKLITNNDAPAAPVEVPTEIQEVTQSDTSEIVLNSTETVSFSIEKAAIVEEVVKFLESNPAPELEEVIEANLQNLRLKLLKRIALCEKKLNLFESFERKPGHEKMLVKLNAELDTLKNLLSKVELWLN